MIALYQTVTNRHTGDHGITLTTPLVFPGITTVTVEWEHAGEYGITEANVDDLLTEYRTCLHGFDASARCGMDTAPGVDYCDQHGGRSPLTTTVAVTA